MERAHAGYSKAIVFAEFKGVLSSQIVRIVILRVYGPDHAASLF